MLYHLSYRVFRPVQVKRYLVQRIYVSNLAAVAKSLMNRFGLSEESAMKRKLCYSASLQYRLLQNVKIFHNLA